MNELLIRAKKRQERAYEIVDRLGLLSKWSKYGDPVVVGATRYGLVVSPDIDMEIYADDPHIEQGFELMKEIAIVPGVWQVLFMNELTGPDMGLYWQIRYRDEDDTLWKVDAWFVRHDHPHAHWCDKFADAMEKTLTEEIRCVILELKESLQGRNDAIGVDVYRAVMQDGVRTASEFDRWLEKNKSNDMVLWLPS